jgi:hypothetical protein
LGTVTCDVRLIGLAAAALIIVPVRLASRRDRNQRAGRTHGEVIGALAAADKTPNETGRVLAAHYPALPGGPSGGGIPPPRPCY